MNWLAVFQNVLMQESSCLTLCAGGLIFSIGCARHAFAMRAAVIKSGKNGVIKILGIQTIRNELVRMFAQIFLVIIAIAALVIDDALQSEDAAFYTISSFSRITISLLIAYDSGMTLTENRKVRNIIDNEHFADHQDRHVT